MQRSGSFTRFERLLGISLRHSYSLSEMKLNCATFGLFWAAAAMKDRCLWETRG